MSTSEMRMRLAGAPAWLHYRDRPESAGQRGTVLFWHGLNVSKEVGAKELRGLADAGFLAVGLDNAGHGERRLPDFERQFEQTPEPTFLQLVRQSAEETPQILDELIRRGWSRPDRIGASGISMGGYIVYLAALKDRRIGVAAPILGSPQWRLPWPDSPHRHAERFFPVALLAQNAGQDQSVPPRYARELHQQLEPHYAQAPERLRYVEFPDSGHFMSEQDWSELWSNTLAWFGRFLGQGA